MVDSSPPEVSAVEAYKRAFEVIVWLHQRGFPNASVELWEDGTGLFRIPLNDDPPDDANQVLADLKKKVRGGRLVKFRATQMAFLEFGYSLRRMRL